jgi:hypothetical protein
MEGSGVKNKTFMERGLKRVKTKKLTTDEHG